MAGNNFQKQRNVLSSGYHLFVVYKPEYALRRTTLSGGRKYFHCYTKRGKTDLDGLLRRVVFHQKHEYEKALLFCKSTNKCLRKWRENGVECSQAEVDAYNNRVNKPNQ